MAQSTAYIVASGIDYTYRFCGVTEIEYNFALNIDADTSQGGDIINGARRLPNQIRLSVVETDVASQPGWAASMLAALDSIRRNRVLCRVVTSMGSWENMLLSEITATQDEANQYGWAGDIVFMQYIPRSEQYYTDTSGGGGASTGSSVSPAAAFLPPGKRRTILPPRKTPGPRPRRARSAALPLPLSAARWRRCWGGQGSE